MRFPPLYFIGKKFHAINFIFTKNKQKMVLTAFKFYKLNPQS